MPAWVQGLGYGAAALCLVALGVRGVVWPRAVMALAGIGFCAYGVLTGTWPVVIASAAIALMSLWRLRSGLAAPAASEIAAVPMEPGHPFLTDFLRANLADIRKSQPDFDPDADAPFVRLITRHGFPAGIVMGRPEGQELTIVLDYVTPRYRDSRQGRWLYGDGKATFTDAGFKRLLASTRTYEHQTYLEGLGFRPEGAWLVKSL